MGGSNLQETNEILLVILKMYKIRPRSLDNSQKLKTCRNVFMTTQTERSQLTPYNNMNIEQ